MEVKTLLALKKQDNYNALSNTFNSFFSFLYNDIQKAEQVILNINAQRWRGREDELHERLTWLAQRVRQLPEKPALIRSWAEYRKNFGGKLSSWLENSHNQEEKIRHALFGYKAQGKDGKTKDIKGASRSSARLKTDIRGGGQTRRDTCVSRCAQINSG